MSEPGDQLPPALARWLPSIESALQRALPADGSGVTAAARYAMGWEDEAGNTSAAGGKRIRPALCVQAAVAFGGTPGDAMPGAAAIELIHNFSLVHDDVQDHDAERHHRPTIWSLHGEAQAINTGDYLYIRAVHTLAAAAGPTEPRMAALRVLGDATSRMIHGQWLDLEFESRPSVSVAEYLEMVTGKTSALIAAPLEIGALLAGAPAPVAARLAGWGLRIGLAFQARDDYLGIWGDPVQTGKSNASDIARRKKTLPIVYGFADETANRAITTTYRQAELTPGDIQAVVAALEAAGADVACREAAETYVAEAKLILAELPLDGDTRAELTAIGQYLVNRDS